MKNKRKHSRAKISLPIYFQDTNSRKLFYTIFKNISEGGLKLVTEKSLTPGQSILFEMELVSSIVKGEGKVTWSSNERNSEKCVAGIEFTNMDEKAKKALCEFLLKMTTT